MKSLSVRVIAPSLLLVGAVVSPVLAWSMDEMTDTQLSTTTGQDGVTVLIAPPPITTGVGSDAAGYTVAGQTLAPLTQTNGLKIGAVVLHDKDGFGSTYDKGGAIIIGDAHQANTGNAVGVAMGIYGSGGIVAKIDATGGAGGTVPMLNVALSLPSDLLIRTGDVSVSASNRTKIANPVGGPAIAVGTAGATVANAAIGGTKGVAYKILNSMDIAFDKAVTLNFQLGNTSQGGMISFGTLNIPKVTFSGISLVSPNGAGVASQLALALSISDLNLTGAIISVANDVVGAMTGTAAATPVGGLIFSDSSFTVGRIELNNVIAGNTSCGTPIPGPCISTNIAQGMANASIGSFGVSGITATNLRIGVSGM